MEKGVYNELPEFQENHEEACFLKMLYLYTMTVFSFQLLGEWFWDRTSNGHSETSIYNLIMPCHCRKILDELMDSSLIVYLSPKSPSSPLCQSNLSPKSPKGHERDDVLIVEIWLLDKYSIKWKYLRNFKNHVFPQWILKSCHEAMVLMIHGIQTMSYQRAIILILLVKCCDFILLQKNFGCNTICAFHIASKCTCALRIIGYTSTNEICERSSKIKGRKMILGTFWIDHGFG